MDNKCTRTRVHTHEHTHTALLDPIKSHLNVLIKLNSTVYLREEKRGEIQAKYTEIKSNTNFYGSRLSF